MKKEEAIAKLSNTKVYVDGKSEEIQRKLFEIGFSWKTFKKQIVNTEMPFIYIHSDLHLLAGNEMGLFKNKELIELKADEILSIKIDKEYEFKPFDRVLVRDYDNANWKTDFFSHIVNGGDEYVFKTISACWKQCVPFEGNEHLVGTTGSPDNN